MLGRQPVVQSERVAFVLQDDVVELRDEGLELAAQVAAERRVIPARLVASAHAQFSAVTRDSAELERCKQMIEIGQRATADESHRAAGPPRERPERVLQLLRHHHIARGGRDIDNGTVHVEQDRAVIEVKMFDGSGGGLMFLLHLP